MADTVTALLPLVKRALNITWESEETELRLNDLIADAVPTLRFKLGGAGGVRLLRTLSGAEPAADLLPVRVQRDGGAV